VGARSGSALDLADQAVAGLRLITELHRTACVLLTAVSTHSRHSVPPKRSILPSVCGWRGEATKDEVISDA
jgi:hypothetical protein